MPRVTYAISGRRGLVSIPTDATPEEKKQADVVTLHQEGNESHAELSAGAKQLAVLLMFKGTPKEAIDVQGKRYVSVTKAETRPTLSLAAALAELQG